MSGHRGAIRFGLVARMVVVLVVLALLPLAVATLGLRDANREAIRDQVRRTHQIGVQAAATRVGAYLEARRQLLDALATNELLAADPRSPGSQAVLRATLGSLESVAGIVLRDADGELILRVQWPDLTEPVDRALEVPIQRPIEHLPVGGAGDLWLLFTSGRAGDEGSIQIVDSARDLLAALHPEEIGSDAEIVLVDGAGSVLAGHGVPAELVERALASDLQGAQAVSLLDGREIVGAWWHPEGVDWTIVSAEPTRSAERVAHRLDRRVWLAVLVALALAGATMAIAYRSVILPVQGIVAAQRQLEGAQGGSLPASLKGLRLAFETLSERVRRREELGRVFLGRYQVFEVVGEGAMGTVFRGWDPKLQRLVALKTILLGRQLTGEGQRQELVRSLLREAVSTARFNHSNIVAVYDVEDSEAGAFVAMEFIEGTTLSRYIWELGELPDQAVATLGLAIARALAAAQEQGIVHRDIKPANVLLGQDGAIKVTDFGIAAFLGSLRDDNTLFGTPGYLAPEAVRGQGYSAVSDLFSLGVVLYQGATGRMPFVGASPRKTLIKTVLREAPWLADVRPTMSYELAALIHRLLAKDPAARPGSAARVAEDLEALCRIHRWEWTGPGEVPSQPSTADTGQPALWFPTVALDP